MCPALHCKSHVLSRRQVSLRIRELGGWEGGKNKKSDQGKLVKNDTNRNNGFSHDFLPSLTDQASTHVFYASGPVLGIGVGS